MHDNSAEKSILNLYELKGNTLTIVNNKECTLTISKLITLSHAAYRSNKQ